MTLLAAMASNVFWIVKQNINRWYTHNNYLDPVLLQSKFPYSVQMREMTNQKNSDT